VDGLALSHEGINLVRQIGISAAYDLDGLTQRCPIAESILSGDDTLSRL
jgi:hypothetical protein